MNIHGKITKIGEVQEGTSKAGKEWKKITFVVETTEEYNNVYPLEILGAEKVDNFIKYNKLDQSVDVEFNVNANIWNDKYFVSLSAWKIKKVPTGPIVFEEEDIKF